MSEITPRQIAKELVNSPSGVRYMQGCGKEIWFKNSSWNDSTGIIPLCVSPWSSRLKNIIPAENRPTAKDIQEVNPTHAVLYPHKQLNVGGNCAECPLLPACYQPLEIQVVESLKARTTGDFDYELNNTLELLILEGANLSDYTSVDLIKRRLEQIAVAKAQTDPKFVGYRIGSGELIELMASLKCFKQGSIEETFKAETDFPLDQMKQNRLPGDCINCQRGAAPSNKHALCNNFWEWVGSIDPNAIYETLKPIDSAVFLVHPLYTKWSNEDPSFTLGTAINWNKKLKAKAGSGQYFIINSNATGSESVEYRKQFLMQYVNFPKSGLIYLPNIIQDVNNAYREKSDQVKYLLLNLIASGFRISPNSEFVIGGEELNRCISSYVDALGELRGLNKIVVDFDMCRFENAHTANSEIQIFLNNISATNRYFNIVYTKDSNSYGKAILTRIKDPYNDIEFK